MPHSIFYIQSSYQCPYFSRKCDI